jgi:hypothetical protein
MVHTELVYKVLNKKFLGLDQRKYVDIYYTSGQYTIIIKLR